MMQQQQQRPCWICASIHLYVFCFIFIILFDCNLYPLLCQFMSTTLCIYTHSFSYIKSVFVIHCVCVCVDLCVRINVNLVKFTCDFFMVVDTRKKEQQLTDLPTDRFNFGIPHFVSAPQSVTHSTQLTMAIRTIQ